MFSVASLRHRPPSASNRASFGCSVGLPPRARNRNIDTGCSTSVKVRYGARLTRGRYGLEVNSNVIERFASGSVLTSASFLSIFLISCSKSSGTAPPQRCHSHCLGTVMHLLFLPNCELL